MLSFLPLRPGAELDPPRTSIRVITIGEGMISRLADDYTPIGNPPSSLQGAKVFPSDANGRESPRLFLIFATSQNAVRNGESKTNFEVANHRKIPLDVGYIAPQKQSVGQPLLFSHIGAGS